jgi:hypothetical protein
VQVCSILRRRGVRHKNMMRAAPINTTISNGMTFASSLSCLSLSVAICFPQGTRPQNKPQLLNLSLFLASVGGLPSSEKPLPFCACRNWSRRRGPAFHKNKTGPPVGRAGVRSPLGLPIQVNREARPSERQIIIRACRAQCVASPSFPVISPGIRAVQATLNFPRRTNLVTSIFFAMRFGFT